MERYFWDERVSVGRMMEGRARGKEGEKAGGLRGTAAGKVVRENVGVGLDVGKAA